MSEHEARYTRMEFGDAFGHGQHFGGYFYTALRAVGAANLRAATPSHGNGAKDIMWRTAAPLWAYMLEEAFAAAGLRPAKWRTQAAATRVRHDAAVLRAMGVVLGVWLAAPENSRGAAVRDYLRAVGLWALVAREHKDRAP
jgi:hypothetical protein